MYLPLLKEATTANHLSLTEKELTQLDRFLQLLHTWNKSFNLTAITDEKQMVYLHIIDSLLAQPFLQGSRCLDVGSGGGLPGIPLAITQPQQNWALVDKNNKKIHFLVQVAAELSLKNLHPLHTRIENLTPNNESPGFNSIISRAFSSLRLFMESTEHLLAKNGIFIAMKGKLPEEEIADLPSRFKIQNVTRLAIQGIKAERHIIVANLD